MKTCLAPAVSFAFAIFVAIPAGSSPALPHAAAEYIPCKVKQTTPAVFPLRLLQEGVLRGEALVVVEIDAAGTLNDALIVAYTHREFAEAGLAAIRKWKYTPGMIGIQPVGSRINITFNFEAGGVVAYEKRISTLPFESLTNERFAYRPHRAAELDQPVRAVEQPRPIYPRQWINEGRKGEVTIEFYIDEDGRPRMATPIGVADDLLAAAAIAAVRQWRFAPPRHKGEAVLVHAQQLFVFEPKGDAS